MAICRRSRQSGETAAYGFEKITTENPKENYGSSKNDPDATGEIAGRAVRSQQQAGTWLPGCPRQYGNYGSEEERHVRTARDWQAGAGRSQGPHGAQPGYRRVH